MEPTDGVSLDKGTIKEYLEQWGAEISDMTASRIWFWIVSLLIVCWLGKYLIRGAKSLYNRYSTKNRWRRDYIKRTIANEYGEYLDPDNYNLFIPTNFQNRPPNDYPDPHDSISVSNTNPLIPKYIKEVLVEKNTNDNLFCVLAGSGMGKTTFAVHLFRDYIYNYNSSSLPYDISLLSLSDENVLDKISQIERPKEHILILDALDENRQALNDFNKFINSLETVIKDFRVVIVTCRTQFFKTEEQELKESKLRNYGSSKGFRSYNRQYISPLTDEEILVYLGKKYSLKSIRPRRIYVNYKKRKKAKRLISSCGNIMVRPLMLSYIDDLLDSQADIATMNDMYHLLIGKWILREAQLVDSTERSKIKGAIWNLSQQLAINLYQNREVRNGYYISMDDFKEFKKTNGFDQIKYSFDSRSLINRNSQGEIKFAHRSFLEFFLAKERLENPYFMLDFEGMDMAFRFFMDVVLTGLQVEVKNKNIICSYIAPMMLSGVETLGLESIEFLKPTEYQFENLSEIYHFRHVTLHRSVINYRMRDWLINSGIESLTIVGLHSGHINFALKIPTLEVLCLQNCMIPISQSNRKSLRSKRVTFINNDTVEYYYPERASGKAYANSKINLVLMKHRQQTEFLRVLNYNLNDRIYINS